MNKNETETNKEKNVTGKKQNILLGLTSPCLNFLPRLFEN